MFGQVIFALIFLSAQATVVRDGETCKFPSFMYVGKSTWQNSPVFESETHMKMMKEIWTMLDDKKSIKIQQFDKQKRKSTYQGAAYDTSEDAINEFILHCHSNIKINDEEYVTIKKSMGLNVTYQCFKFTKRSEIIINFAKSPEAATMGNNLCGSSLFTSPSSLAYFEAAFGYYQNLEEYLYGKPYLVCPLKGSYEVEGMLSDGDQNECPGKYSPDEVGFRVIENECESGEGMTFPMASKRPKSRQGPACDYLATSLYCLASWKKEGYTYMLIAHPGDINKGVFHCAKYLGENGVPEDNMIYLFKNGICDYTEDLSLQQGYVKYRVRKRGDTNNIDICSDITEECKTLPRQECTGSNGYKCAERCEACPAERWWEQSRLDERYQGTFRRDSLVRGEETIIFDGKFLQIPQMGEFDILGEDVCQYEYELGSFSNVTTYLLLKKGTDSGCGSYMAVMAITEVNPSIFLYKISQWKNTHSIKFPANDDRAIEKLRDMICPLMFFHTKHYKPVENVYQHSEEAWDILVKEPPLAPGIACAHKVASLTSLIFEKGSKCQVNTTPRDNDTVFDVSIGQCLGPKNEQVRVSEGKRFTYECMAIVQGKDAKYGEYLITKSIGNVRLFNKDFLCWMVLEEKAKGYWMPIGDCHPRALYEIGHRGNLQPLATLESSSCMIRSIFWLIMIPIFIITGLRI